MVRGKVANFNSNVGNVEKIMFEFIENFSTILRTRLRYGEASSKNIEYQ